MADQKLHAHNLLFDLELHGVRTKDAKRVISRRLAECYRYGLLSLRCSYGSPDVYEGSILHALHEIVLTSDYVHRDSLPDWIYEKVPSQPSPVFLTIPIASNPSPIALDENANFEGFDAIHEENRGQRLLCEMPFQPLRTVYDWQYAAKAIKRDCSESALVQLSRQLGTGNSNEGLTLAELMTCAVAWGNISRSQKRDKRNQNSRTIENEAPSKSHTSLPEPLFVEWSGAPTVDALLLLADRFIERGEYDSALKAVDHALLLDEQEQNHRVFLTKGRILLLRRDPSCETWLLRADEDVSRLSGPNSPKRIAILSCLRQWYCQAHEYERFFHYTEIESELAPRNNQKFSLVKEFRLRTIHAELLRRSGDYKASTRSVMAALRCALSQTPGAFTDSVDFVRRLRICSIPTILVAGIVRIGLMNSFDFGEVDLAAYHLDMLDQLLVGSAVPDDWQVSLQVARGNISHARGNARDALKHYEEALTSIDGRMNSNDPLKYEVLGNMAVALRASGKLEPAGNCYRQCIDLAVRLEYNENPVHATLLMNYCLLLARQYRYKEVVTFAGQAYDLLLLKKPSAYADIGHCLSFLGHALNELGRFHETTNRLSDGKKYLTGPGKTVDGLTLQAIDVLLNRAREQAAHNQLENALIKLTLPELV